MDGIDSVYAIRVFMKGFNYTMRQRSELFILFCVFFIFSLVLNACSQMAPRQANVPVEVSLPEAESEDSGVQQESIGGALDSQEPEQPISPLNPPDSPLAIPSSGTESAQILPPLEIVHDRDSGAVIGQLIFVDENGERPVEGIILALGTMLKDEETGLQIVVSYKAAIAPRAVTDEYGRFIFNEVKPDTYGLILDAVMASSLLNYPDQDMSFVFDVAADEVMDLGELRYDELPAPGYTK